MARRNTEVVCSPDGHPSSISHCGRESNSRSSSSKFKALTTRLASRKTFAPSAAIQLSRRCFNLFLFPKLYNILGHLFQPGARARRRMSMRRKFVPNGVQMQSRVGSDGSASRSDRQTGKNKCVSRLVRRKSHHTDLSSAAAPIHSPQLANRPELSRDVRPLCRYPCDSLRAKVHQKGRGPVRIVGQHAGKISRPYLFPPLRNR